jgi:UDP-glucose 4-epimerase
MMTTLLSKRILLTGGMGYIGSHTAVVLAQLGYEVFLYDNLCNAKVTVLDRLEKIVFKRLPFIKGDVRDQVKLEEVLRVYQIDAVIHFAGLKAVGESTEKPIEYYDNNLVGAISLIKAMESANVKKLVFSSSATVYGAPQYLPLDEVHPTRTTNPYGSSKLQIENILADVAMLNGNSVNHPWRIACLRYFNPVGAHNSGLIGENPNGTPNNLMPYINFVASGKLPILNVFGGDYDTPDGTGIRDYIHVMDLAEGHKAALDFLDDNIGWHAINLGSGIGYSVLEILKTFELVTKQVVPYRICPRRIGDVSVCYAKVDKAKQKLGWRAERTLEDICKTAWRFQLSYL